MTGKNFSANNAKGLRKKSDFYETPYSLTRLFLDKYQLQNEVVLEPACGNGAIVKVLEEFEYNVIGTDIQTTGDDFLQRTEKVPCIMTNPPFSLSYEFILKAKELCKEFVFLLPLSYLHGKQRYDNIYTDTKFPLKEVWVFTRYPMLGDELREDGKVQTGMMVYAWFVWSKVRAAKGPPTIHWLDNNDYVLGSSDKRNQNTQDTFIKPLF